MKKVLFVLTSHSELHRRKNRVWTEEFAAPYYELADKGVIIIQLKSQPPIDPKVKIHLQLQDTKI
jgi:hypothetical protein